MIKSRTTLKQLEALAFVADTGTFRKAAAALGTTQPNVSVRISALEDTLGVVLMHRDAGSVRFTETGLEVLAAAREVLRAAEAVLETADRRDLIEEKLRLGVGELIACTWLHDFLRAFRERYPAIRVELTVDLSSELERMLGEGQLDLAMLNGPFKSEDGTLIPLDEYRYGWIATPEIASALGPRPDFEALLGAGLLSHGKNTGASLALKGHLTASGLDPAQVAQSSSLASTLQMAADGMGVALLPRQLFREAVAEGRLVEIDPGWTPEPLRFFARYDAGQAPLFLAKAAELAVENARTHRR